MILFKDKNLTSVAVGRDTNLEMAALAGGPTGHLKRK